MDAGKIAGPDRTSEERDDGRSENGEEPSRRAGWVEDPTKSVRRGRYECSQICSGREEENLQGSEGSNRLTVHGSRRLFFRVVGTCRSRNTVGRTENCDVELAQEVAKITADFERHWRWLARSLLGEKRAVLGLTESCVEHEGRGQRSRRSRG